MSAEVQTLGGRPIIDADTEILGGVFIARNAIYVDFAENPEPYEVVYRQIDEQLSAETNATPLFIARAVNSAVMENVWYSEEKWGAVLKAEAKARGLEELSMTDPVDLSKFIEEGGAICTQQTLVAGTMLRLLQDRRGIGGQVSINPPQAPPRTHIWASYTDDSTEIFVDPAWHVASKFADVDEVFAKKYIELDERLSAAPDDLNFLQAA